MLYKIVCRRPVYGELQLILIPRPIFTNRTPGEKYGLVLIVFGRVCHDRLREKCEVIIRKDHYRVLTL